jgi:SpoVK/Ycf46/Vps4 family AAA+-type ATPase
VEVNAHSLFSKWFSESGKLVSKLFAKITELVEDESCLVFVLIDEVESLTAARKVGCAAAAAAAAAAVAASGARAGSGAGAGWQGSGAGLPALQHAAGSAALAQRRRRPSRLLLRCPGAPSSPRPAGACCAALQAAVGGSEPSDAIRAVNALLTQLDQLKRFPNVSGGPCAGLRGSGPVGGARACECAGSCCGTGVEDAPAG